MAFGDVVYTLSDPDKLAVVTKLFEEAHDCDQTIREMAAHRGKLQRSAWKLIDEAAASEGKVFRGKTVKHHRIFVLDMDTGKVVDKGPSHDGDIWWDQEGQEELAKIRDLLAKQLKKNLETDPNNTKGD